LLWEKKRRANESPTEGKGGRELTSFAMLEGEVFLFSLRAEEIIH